MIDLLKNENKINKFFLAFALLIFVMILSLSFNAFYQTDDYLFVYELKINGVLENCINGYYNWDGRFLTLGAFIQCLLLQNFPIEFIVLFWSISFLISGLLIYYIINLEFDFTFLSKKNKLFILIILSLILWIGSFLHISETIYWGTGGVYSFDLFIGAIWTFLFLKIQKTDFNFVSKFGFLIFSFIAGATTQNLTIALVTLTLITIIIDLLKKTNAKQLNNILFILALVIGILFISLAPGNQNRMDGIKQIKPDNFILFYYIKNFFKTLFLYSIASSVLCFLTIIIAFIISILINPKFNFKVKFDFIKLKTKQNLIDFLIATKWLWVATSTVTAFLTIPEFVSRRTSIYFIYFMMLFTLVSVLRLLKYFAIESNEIKIIKRNLIIKNALSVLVLTLFFIYVAYNLTKSYQLKQAVTARETILKNGRNKTVYLKLIDPKLNSICYKYDDFYVNGKEAFHFIIENQERYFGTKIIVVK